MIFLSNVTDQMSAFGDFTSGSIPPMANPAPTTPPCAFRPPPDCGFGPVPVPKVGKVNPYGALLLLPRTKIGACALAVPLGPKNVGATSPGGLPRNSSLGVGLRQPVVVDAESAAYHPIRFPGQQSQAKPMRGLEEII